MTGAAELTSGKRLARGVAMNVAGGLLPALSALAAVPPLVRELGEARFGILALVWTTLGYFSLFDLGIGRALTHAVAHRLGDGRQEETASVVWSALVLLLPLGLAGAAVLYAMSPWLARTALNTPAELQAETELAFRVLAVAIPFTAMTAVLRGVLEAKQRFGWVNALRTPYGIVTFLGPVAVLPFSHSLVPAAVVITASRALLALAHLVVCARIVTGFTEGRPRRDVARALLRFGGWMTVSNIVSPLMNTLDRFVVGGVLTVSAVTYYAAPHELVTKMWLFTAAVLPVFFPAFATSVVRDRARTALLFDRTLRMTLVALTLPTLLLVVLAPEVLGVWLGPEFAARSAGVLQVLALAVFVNTLGQGALTLVQAMGRPDVTGKYHLAELPLYAALLWYLLPRYGIMGVAVAWAVRAIVDAALLLATAAALLREASGSVRRTSFWVGAITVSCGVMAMVPSASVRVAAAMIAVPVWMAISWRSILTAEERVSPMRTLRMVSGN